MPDERVGRPRDGRLHRAILDATRELLTTGSYAELSMERVAASARVGKKTLYRRWSSKAPLVAEAVLEAYGGSGSFPVAATGDIRGDLRTWLNAHADFLAEPSNSALIRALIAGAGTEAVANALVATMLFGALAHPGSSAGRQLDGLVDALPDGVSSY